MNARTLRILALSGLAVLITAALAFAQPGMGRGGYGPGGYGPGGCPGWGYGAQAQALTPEQQQKFDQLFDAHQKRTFALRQDIWAKQTELNALSGNPNTKPERISQLVNELKDLRAKMFTERESFQAALRKEGLPAGLAYCGGQGMGFGGRHGGHGAGRGMMRGGAW